MTTTVNHQKTTSRNAGSQTRMLAVRNLEAVPISATEWRIHDIAEYDPQSVLGFIRQLGDTYELTVARSPLDRYYFASLEDGVDYLNSGRATGR